MSKSKHMVTIKPSQHDGQCGSTGNDTWIFPFFRMGCCGYEDYVTRIVEMPKPTAMNYEWFALIAVLLKRLKHFDWDWCSFRDNVLKPNKEHIMIELNINDDMVSTLMSNGYVFLNNFFYDGEDSAHPSFDNFLKNPKGLDY